jgi:hypothetical protein
MNSSIIHVKMKPKIAHDLKLLSKKRSLPVGELVRQAVSRCYYRRSKALLLPHFRGVI